MEISSSSTCFLPAFLGSLLTLKSQHIGNGWIQLLHAPQECSWRGNCCDWGFAFYGKTWHMPCKYKAQICTENINMFYMFSEKKSSSSGQPWKTPGMVVKPAPLLLQAAIELKVFGHRIWDRGRKPKIDRLPEWPSGLSGLTWLITLAISPENIL